MQRQFYAHAKLGMVMLEVGQKVTLKTLIARDKSHYENVPATITMFTPTNNRTSEGTFKVITDNEFEVAFTDFVTGEISKSKERLVVPTNIGSIDTSAFQKVTDWKPIGVHGTDFMKNLENGKAITIKRTSPLNAFEEYEITYADGSKENAPWSLTSVVEHINEKMEKNNA